MRLSNASRFLMAVALLAGAGIASAADKISRTAAETDAALVNQVRHEIVMYADYSIWDDVTIAANNGVVRLSGVVVQPIKREEMDRLARQVAGAGKVENDIRVLPLSNNDDRLRLQIARAIYGDPAMLRYRNQPLKPIHIVVENGHVMLNGIVDTTLDKQLAGTRAATAGMSFGKIVNNLQVVGPATKKG